MRLSLKVEKFCNPVIFTEKTGKSVEGRKKGYALRVLWQDGRNVDYCVIKGFPYVRRDSSNVGKHIEKAVLEIALKGAASEKDTQALRLSGVYTNVSKLVQDVRALFLAGVYSIDDMSITVCAQKTLSSYDPRPAFVRGIYYFNEHVATTKDLAPITEGETAQFLYVKRVLGCPPTDVLAYMNSHDIPEVTPDLNRMFEREVKSKVDKKLKIMGVTWMQVIGQMTMEDFI